jgi:acyl-[acyl-carrier-protein]-phospholipid O-acyltransferase/long-chain-fatty-acid--[acyl-carrier-protein] ligase
MRRILLEMQVVTQPPRTLFQAFLEAKSTFGDGYKLVEDVRLEEESCGSLLRMSLGLSRLLAPMTKVDEMVGVLMPNAAATLGLLLGLSAARRVPAMLNYTAGIDGVKSACTAANIRKIVASRAFIGKARLEVLVAGLSGFEVIYLEDLKTRLSLLDKLWIVLAQRFPKMAIVAQEPGDPAVVLFTSGSEGKPKGVVHSHVSLLSNIAQIRSIADFTPLDKFMVALPLFHSFGLACGAIMPLVSGCKPTS